MSNTPYDSLPTSVPLTDDIADSTNVEETVARRQLLERMFEGLDKREAKILMMIAEGYTTVEIMVEIGETGDYGRELVSAVHAKARGFKGEL